MKHILHPDTLEKDKMKLSVIIPVYNERDTIHDIIEAVSTTPPRKDIIVVDNGSTDGTGDKLGSMQQAILSLSRMLTLIMIRKSILFC